ncbi:MAG: LptF/LptG family permease [Candidatus Aureabacteria bacterium]|nr:LptF/LptG family permease [Candidatus Auribacterota bacterium]
MRLLYRYIISELLTPFLLSLTVLTSIILMTKILNIADLLLDKNVKPQTLFEVTGSIALYLLGITLPLAFLISILICFSRLSNENEILALRGGGINISKIAFPVFLMGSVLFGLSYYLHGEILPRADWKSVMAIYDLSQFSPSTFLQEKVWMEGLGNSSIYIKNIQENNHVKNIAIRQVIPGYSIPREILADSGKYSYDPQTQKLSFILYDAHVDQPAGDSKRFLRIDCKTYSLALSVTDKDFSKPKKRAYHLTFNELDSQISETPKNQIDYRYLVYEKHSRIALAFASLVFFMLGFPLSVRLQSSAKSASLTIGSVLGLLWYILLLLGKGLFIKEHLPVPICAWLPNMIMGTAGVILMRRIWIS